MNKMCIYKILNLPTRSDCDRYCPFGLIKFFCYRIYPILNLYKVFRLRSREIQMMLITGPYEDVYHEVALVTE